MATSKAAAKNNLFKDLFADYISGVDPSPTELTVGLTPRFIKYDKTTNDLTVGVWEFHQWKDSRLSWDPANYDGLTTIRVPSKNVWLPDTQIYNSVVAVLERDSSSRVVLSSDGTVIWVPQATYRVLGEQKNDEISGNFKFGSWTYNDTDLALKLLEGKSFDLSYFEAASQYTFASSSAKLSAFDYEGEKYPLINFEFVVKPRA